jgi:hypothetical protein
MPRTGAQAKTSDGVVGYLRSVHFIRQELTAHDDAHPVAFGVGFALDVHGKVDGAHDAVAELFMDQLLDAAAIHADQFVETINQWVAGHGGGQRTFIRWHLQQAHGLGRQFQQGANLAGLLRLQAHLA